MEVVEEDIFFNVREMDDEIEFYVNQNDDEQSQEYFMSNEVEEGDVVVEGEGMNQDMNITESDSESDAPIATLATKARIAISKSARLTGNNRDATKLNIAVSKSARLTDKNCDPCKEGLQSKPMAPHRNIVKCNSSTTLKTCESNNKTKCIKLLTQSRTKGDDEDPFIGARVAFHLAKETGKWLTAEFSNKLQYEAVCFDLDDTVGHIIRMVMRHHKRSRKTINYQVIWEYTALGESILSLSEVLECYKEAEKLDNKRMKRAQRVTRNVSRIGRGADEINRNKKQWT